MFKSLFNREKGPNFLEFVRELKKANRDLFQLLRTPESRFEEASFEELLSNQADVLSGVNRVQKNFRDTYFAVFNGCLVKHHDNGDIKFVFFTTTSNTESIFHFSQVLFNEFGHGYYKETEFTPFTDKEKVIRLSKGVYENSKDDIVHLWFYEDLSILLQYTTTPLRQFSLMVTQKATKEYDKSTRRNGTVLDLLDIDVNNILLENEIEQIPTVEDNKVKFIDYVFSLSTPAMNAFDKLSVRIFDDKRSFRKDIQTHLTFSSFSSILPDDKIMVAEKLIKIYGQDDGGTNEIEFHERELIEQGDFWTGRRWSLNDRHGLWNMDNKDETYAYSVTVDNIDEIEGFCVNILSYNSLVSLFKAEN